MFSLFDFQIQKNTVNRLNELTQDAYVQNSVQETTVAADEDDHNIPRLDDITGSIQVSSKFKM